MLLNVNLISFIIALISSMFFGVFCEDEIDEFHSMVGEWIEYAFSCKQKIEDSGTPINYGSCIALLNGNPGIDASSAEYTPCKCISSCISKKIGSLKADGSGWNTTRLDEIVTLMAKVEQYKPFVEEIKKIRPICEASPGVDCELAHNTVKCIFDHSETARNFRDTFTSMVSTASDSSSAAAAAAS